MANKIVKLANKFQLKPVYPLQAFRNGIDFICTEHLTKKKKEEWELGACQGKEFNPRM